MSRDNLKTSDFIHEEVLGNAGEEIRKNRERELEEYHLTKEEIESCVQIFKYWYREFQRMGIEISMADAAFLRQMIRENYINSHQLHDLSQDSDHPFDGPRDNWLWHMYGINVEDFQRMIKKEYHGQSLSDLLKLAGKYREKTEYV